MSVLYIALPIALGLGALALYAFARTVREGQLDDLETPALRILFEDEPHAGKTCAPRPPI